MVRHTHVTMDNNIVSWQEIVGDPNTNPKLIALITKLLAEQKRIIDREHYQEIENVVCKLLAEFKKELGDLSEIIDPYKIKWHDTTVGDALDEIFQIKLSGTISEPQVHELGEHLVDVKIAWKFNKPLKKLVFKVFSNDKMTEKVVLDVKETSYTIPNLTNSEAYKVVGTTEDGEKCVLETRIDFKLKWYCGVLPDVNPSNEALINLSRGFVDKETQFHERLFDCSHGTYIYYAFPDDLHKKYDFITNGFCDSGWVWETKDLVNKYGYFHTYRVFRTINLLHGAEIHSEVHYHEQ